MSLSSPIKIRLYVALAALAAATSALAALTLGRTDLTADAFGFALIAFLMAQRPLRLPTGALYDITFVITFAAIVAQGPATAVVVNLASTFTLGAQRRGAIRDVFNASQLAISAAIPALVYQALGGPIGDAWRSASGPIVDRLPQAFVALAVASTLHFALNTGLVSGAIALSERHRFLAIWRTYRGLARNYVAFALLGLLLGILQVQLGWGSMLFLVIPLLVARHAFQAYVQMERAYDDTVRSLIKGLEAKDPYTRGHAERVSRLSELVARAYGLPDDQSRVIRYAALMHDIGKLGVESKILKKPGKLTPEEYEHMKVHPIRGVEIIGEIDLLEIALTGVRHHHERVDGGGYPDGLEGDEIPLFARLIMVADAFDSMTSTRVYRKAKTIEEALSEIHRCEGTQFDPVAVRALERALQRYGWEPHPELEGSWEQMAEATGGEHAASL